MMKRTILAAALLSSSCSRAEPERKPTSTASAPLKSYYPLRTASCGASGGVVLTDLEPSVLTLHDAALAMANSTRPRVQPSDGALVADGSDVVDLDSAARAVAPVHGHPTGRWSKAAHEPTFAYAYDRLDDGTSHVDVFGKRAWSRSIPGVVRSIKLSSDGAFLAALVRRPESNEEHLAVFDARGEPASTVELGDSTSEVLLFDAKDNRIGVVKNTSDGEDLVVVSTAGKVLLEASLGHGAAPTQGTFGVDSWGALNGDTFWLFGSHWRGNGEGLNARSQCDYLRMTLPTDAGSVRRVFAQDLPAVFGTKPDGECDVRIMCPTDGGGAILLRHDFETVTAERWASPP